MFTMLCVTKAMPIKFDGKCHIKKWKYRTGLTGYSACLSWRQTHTHACTHHTHTHTNFPDKNNFKKPGAPVCADICLV